MRIKRIVGVLAAAVLTAALAAPAAASTPQVSPQVIAAGQAYWAQSNQGQAPCISVTVTYKTYGELATGEPERWGEAPIGAGPAAFLGAPVQTACDFILSDKLSSQPLAFQSMVVAHEIGHNAMGLEHLPNPSDLMYAASDPTHVLSYFTAAFPVPAAQAAAAKAAAKATSRCGKAVVASKRTSCAVARRTARTFNRALANGNAITSATVRVSTHKRVSVRYRLRGSIVTATARGGISVKFSTDL